MKLKRIAVILSVIGLFSLGGTAYALKLDNDKKDQQLVVEQSNYPEIYNTVDSITFDSFKEKLEKQEDFYVYVGRPTCGDCNDFEPEFIKLVEEKNISQQMFYLNVAKVKENKEEWEKFKLDYNIKYTPTLAKYSKGILTNKIEWTPENGISLQKVAEWIDRYVEPAALVK